MTDACKRILVTGASGFIGSHLCQKLFREGHQIIAMNRSGSPIDGATETVSWQLGEPVPGELPACDVAIHLAHDFSGEVGAQRSISGTKALVAFLYAHGTGRQLFVTSYSAGTHARSLYGKSKGILEEALRKDKRTIIVRPGLVLGEGGIYGKIAKVARKSPVVPLPDGGRGLVTVITIDRLCDEMARLCMATDPPQDANLFEPQMVTLRQLVQKVASDAGRRPLFVPVPISLALPIFRMVEALGLPLPVSSESLVGFVQNQSAAHVSTLENENGPI